MGIIAGIIALKKGHPTFAACMFAWFAIALILTLCGVTYAAAPGWIFVIIAISMKKKDGTEDDRVPVKYDDPVLKCPNCDSSIREGMSNCINCGTKIELSDSEKLYLKQCPNASNYGLYERNPIMQSSEKSAENYLNKIRPLNGNEISWSFDRKHLVSSLLGVKDSYVNIYTIDNNGTLQKVYICTEGIDSNYPPHGYRIVDNSEPDILKTDESNVLSLPPSEEAVIDKKIEDAKISQNNAVKVRLNKRGMPEVTDNRDQVAFCRKCGNKLQTGSLFCNKCGTKVV